jgi:hypothetical protein
VDASELSFAGFLHGRIASNAILVNNPNAIGGKATFSDYNIWFVSMGGRAMKRA